jgi:hypothetical protein
LKYINNYTSSKTLFSKFVCSRVRTRCEPWGYTLFLCLTIVTIFAEFPVVVF